MQKVNIFITATGKLFGDEKKIIISTVNSVLKAEKIQNAEVSVLITNDRHIKKLNKEYRGRNKPTNVLSFHQNTDTVNKRKYNILGDIVISRDAVKKGIYYDDEKIELSFFVIHGLLHLLGYNHKIKKDIVEMESREKKCLQQLFKDKVK